MSGASPGEAVIERRVESGRLAWYRSDADDGFWSRTWSAEFERQKRRYRRYERGCLDEYERPFTRWLPREGRIVEAGCGLAKYVIGLRARGYDVEGIDSDENSVEMVRAELPGLPLRVADARALDVPDGHYAGYVSLGVIEHVAEGPNAFVKEAFRVLAPGGRAIFTVPWFNPLRRRRASKGEYDGPPSEYPFYQFAFSETELFELMASHGFVVVDSASLSAYKGVKDEVPAVAAATRLPVLGRRLVRLMLWAFRVFPRLGHRVGHMILVVAEKPGS